MADVIVKNTCFVPDAYDVYSAPEGAEVTSVPTLRPSQALRLSVLGLGISNINRTPNPEHYNEAGCKTFRRWQQIQPSFMPTTGPLIGNLAEIISTALHTIGNRQDLLYFKKIPHPLSACSLVISPKNQAVFAYVRGTIHEGAIKKGATILAIPFNDKLPPYFVFLKTPKKWSLNPSPSGGEQKRLLSPQTIEAGSDALMKEIEVEKLYGPKPLLAFKIPRTIVESSRSKPLQLIHSIGESFDGDLSKFKSGLLTDFGMVCLFLSFISQLRCIHESGKIHGDIKITNMVWRRTLQRGIEYKFIDFEFMFDPAISLHYTLERLGVYGSRVPTAPEVFLSLPPFRGDCFAAEMWALGYALFCPLFEKAPSWHEILEQKTHNPKDMATIDARQKFECTLKDLVVEEVSNMRGLIERWSPIRKELAEICFSMFDLNPATRSTAKSAEERTVALYKSITGQQ